MMNIRNIEIGIGRPKICVPILEEEKKSVLEQARRVRESCADLTEWRVDFFKFTEDVEQVLSVLRSLREILGDMPLLFTFRTAKEGGNRQISWEAYAGLLKQAADSGFVDMIDLEVFRGYDERLHPKKEWRVTDACNRNILDLIELLSEKVILIGSYHDFEKTPSREEMLRRFLFMDRMGVDIPKLAVMPAEREDVLRLMDTTSLAERLIVEKPLISMAMGALGVITRVSGEAFGSSVSFGCLGKASAPGQIEAETLRDILDTLSGLGSTQAL